MFESSFQQEVIATVRLPDGQPNARIDGLVLRSLNPSDGHPIIDLPTSIARAQAGSLWTKVPNDGRAVRVVAVDTNGDGIADAVKTEADGIYGNNLLAHPIWDRIRRQWVDPRSGYPCLSP